MLEVIKTYPLATVISVSENQPYITHLPLVYKDNILVGHIDKFNPQAALLKENREVTVIFSGPNCYISPSVYTTKQLPTWNYIKVHLKGTVKAIKSKEALKHSLIEMTEFLEAPDHKYILDSDNKRMEAALDYIDMFEIEITDWEGKFKLSQDKKTADKTNARNELLRANKENIEAFLGTVFNL